MSRPTPKTDTKTSKEPTTREDCMEAITSIQGDMLGCIGDLTVLDGFLSGDPLEHDDDIAHILLSARDIVGNARQCVKTALDRTFKIL